MTTVVDCLTIAGVVAAATPYGLFVLFVAVKISRYAYLSGERKFFRDHSPYRGVPHGPRTP